MWVGISFALGFADAEEEAIVVSGHLFQEIFPTEIFIFTRYYAQPGAAEEVQKAPQEVVPLSNAKAGCLRIHAFRSIRDPQVFYIRSQWKNEAAFETHAGRPHTVRFIERVEPLLDPSLQADRCKMVV